MGTPKLTNNQILNSEDKIQKAKDSEDKIQQAKNKMIEDWNNSEQRKNDVFLLHAMLKMAFDEKVDIEPIAKHFEEIGFFDSPASTKYHGSYFGGLIKHVQKVVEIFQKLKDVMNWKYDTAQIYQLALFHDIGKCLDGHYELNFLKTTKELSKVKTFNFIPMLNIGHPNASIYLIAQWGLAAYFSDDEIQAIRYHMNTFNTVEHIWFWDQLIASNPLVLDFQLADYLASKEEGITDDSNID
jgi:hypothetical protein